MKPAAQKVQQIIDELGLNSQIVEFSESTRTSAEAAAAIGTSVAQICKSILFAAGDKENAIPVMVIASGANRIDTHKVQTHIGQKLHKATPEFVREKTGYAIGGVPPFAHAQPLTIFIDQDLLAFEVVYAAGGTPNAIFPLNPADLVKVTGGAVIDCRVDN
ncbi:YbaK/EbsC family protein [Candidatus Chlorohelix allophototropha]|uniref:YbaK/EbsC family protein n=1 Tax=Candidatus Chlorohelix allophototropha TaxID=3003348 RepID=A0ABY9B7L8_9CHLR|nr:YbaK/EbsC family protein [Chloroflexota bacterium L227-S17]